MRYTNEGPTVVKRSGKYYVQYSGGSWDLPTYSLGYAVSTDIPTRNSTIKYVPPILKSSTLVEGPGHNGMTLAPNNIDDICVYHARIVPFTDCNTRKPFIDRLYWNHERQFMNAPALAVQSIPDWPLFSTILSENTADQWTIVSGDSWQFCSSTTYSDYQLKVDSSSLSSIMPKIEQLSDYLFEVNLRVKITSSSWRVGVSALSDKVSNVNVWIRSDNMIQVEEHYNGKLVKSDELKLMQGFDATVYHQLVVVKRGEVLSVAVDGIRYQRFLVTNASVSETAVAIQCNGTGAEFAGITVSSYYHDTFETLKLSPYYEIIDGHWEINTGALLSSSNSALIRGDATMNYEFSVDVLWNSIDDSGTIGIIASRTETEIITAGFENKSWPFGHFIVTRNVNGKIEDTFKAQLPRGYLYDIYHNIRVVKYENRYTFYLDNKEIIAHQFVDSVIAKPGLYASVSSSFMNAIMKRVIVPQNIVLNPGFETSQWNEAYTKPVQGNPWKLDGVARPNYCCAHSGLNRLVVSNGEGSASQTVTIEKGLYRLVAFVSDFCDDPNNCYVELSAGETKQPCKTRGGRWTMCTIEFEALQGQNTIRLFARSPVGLIAFDDIMLYKI